MMIIAGLKLALLGMAVVFFFLLLLVFCIKISFRLFSALNARELAEMETAKLRKRRRPPAIKPEDEVLVAVISAAIAAHRARSLPVR
ncbi:MAG: OadG family protein [Desulfobacteraceae bacterium]|jgi:sodium pump decarboxylase gamma subunit|nr:OadG family protein [Desulfobacteraceae bacterium]